VSGRRRALVTAGVAAGAVAGGVFARAVVSRRRTPDPGTLADLDAVPPEDLGPIRSFDGTELAVRAAGDPAAPVLIFVHGFGLDMTTWHFQWASLSGRFRCVCLDLRSHGRSARANGGGLTPDAFGRDVLAVLDTLEEGRGAVVIGHSMGGIAVLAAADAEPARFSARVRGVVFVGAASGDLLRGALGSVTGILRPSLGSLAAALRGVDALRRAVVSRPVDLGHLVTRAMQFGPDAPPRAVEHVAALAARGRSEVWTDGLAELMDVDLRHVMQHVGMPALVLVGEHDRVTPRTSAEALSDALPAGRLESIPRAGHIPMLERPEDVTDRIRAFAEECFT
jgi:pimeloyl-ACP methyl ester carboxylesterase